MMESGEQHLSCKATGDVIVLDGDGSRWVREGEVACPAWTEGVPAPVDADGEFVPLDVVELHMSDGEPVFVESICFDGNWWYAQILGKGAPRRLEAFHVAPPDTWEQLEKDAANGPCDYFGTGTNSCFRCPAYEVRFNGCNAAEALDIVRRAKALAGRDTKEADRD